MNQFKIFSAIAGMVSIFAVQVLFSNSAMAQCCKPPSEANAGVGIHAPVNQQMKGEEVKLKITGLTCAGCAGHLNKVLSETNGVIKNSVEYPGDLAVIEYDPKKITPEEIIKTIEEKTSYMAEVQKEKTNNKS